jgi:hypothetical protein
VVVVVVVGGVVVVVVVGGAVVVVVVVGGAVVVVVVVLEAGAGVRTKYAATPAITRITTIMATVAEVEIALRLSIFILKAARRFRLYKNC